MSATPPACDNILDASTYGLPYGPWHGDPVGDVAKAALPVAVNLALILASDGLLAPELAGPSLGILEGKSATVTEKGLSIIEAHWGGLDPADYNDAMLGRLRSSMASGSSISGSDLVFYTHELSEAKFMSGGISYDEAHAAALGKYGVSPFAIYPPDIVIRFGFGPFWKKAWGIQ